MSNDIPVIEPIFNAALSRKSMEDGELNHMKIELLRKTSMYAGLTNSSDELKGIYSSNPKEFQDSLEFGLQSYEHYQNLLLLLENAILRIYSVATNDPSWDGNKSIENLEERITKILSASSKEHQH